MWPDIALIVGSYLLGSLPHLAWLGRLRRVNLQGDFHSDLWERGGKTLGVIGVLGEFVKGVAPVLVGRWFGLGTAPLAIAGLAVVCGQMWPVFARFNGEKGNSVAIATAAVLVPRSALVAIIPALIAIAVRTGARLAARSGPPEEKAIVGGAYSRSLPLGMAVCFVVLPLASWYFGEPPAVVWSNAVMFVLIMVRRLTAGLRADLKAGADTKRVLAGRLLFDRGLAAGASSKGRSARQ